MSGIVGSRLNIRGSGLVGNIGTDGQVLTSSGAGQEIVFEAAGGGVDGITDNSNANAITIDSSENVALDSGNLVISTSGKGIDFSAVTGTAASNATEQSAVLDSYEEGTWTPKMVSATGGTTLLTTTNYGSHYVRIGNWCFLQFNFYHNITTPAVGASGKMTLEGWPFAFPNNASHGNAHIPWYGPVHESNTAVYLGMTFTPNSSAADFNALHKDADGYPSALGIFEDLIFSDFSGQWFQCHGSGQVLIGSP